VAVDNVCELLQAVGKPIEKCVVAVVGGAGSEGSACSKLLAGKVAKLILVDKNVKEGENLVGQLAEYKKSEIKFTTKLASIREADAVITVTNAPGAIVRASHLKPGAVIVDGAQPKNVSRHVSSQRKDVLVVDSAIVKTPGVHTNYKFDLGETEALGCLAETQILAWMGHKGHFSLGKPDLKQVHDIAQAAKEAGYKLAPFRNSVGYVSKEDVSRVRRANFERDLASEPIRNS
jgi:predicted amino acid dehydrogenase